ncbi:MAG: AAA family ATPase [Gemmatimonadales bacterium]
MKLTRLELSGFKSFADKAALRFEAGVTAIVGPNGCGKSNISDAVRWVLGEQRVRLLRGSKMEEIIFQGSAKRRPTNIAEVSLYLDNSDDALAIAYNEVVLTRRLSRSGQSDYLLNGSPVRLRDLQDLLKGTGLGSDVGVVIEAQMIDRLLSDRPDERRSLFEEAAGISLYRDRKISTQRRLERTSDDLQRLDDLIGEVQTQIRSLARQKGKAERHRKFTQERRAIVATLTRRELDRMDQASQQLDQRRAQLATEIPAMREHLQQLERERDAAHETRATTEASRTELERRLAESRIEVERLEGDLNLASERIENAAVQRTRAVTEQRQAHERAVQATREREAAAAERSAAQTSRQSVQTELDLRSTTEADLREQLANQRGSVRELEEAKQRQAEALRSLAGEKEALLHEVENLKPRAKQAEERRKALAREVELARAEVDRVRGTLENRTEAHRAAVSELERARHDLAAAREHEASIQIELRSAEEKAAQLRARREALEGLEQEREGLAPAAHALLEQQDRFGAGAILGPLSDFVTASENLAGSVEHLLGEWLHAVLVRDDDVVASVMNWHAKMQPGNLVLLPVAAGPRNAGPPTSEFDVAVTEPAAPWVHSLLSRAGEITVDGAIRRANGAVYLPSAESSGPLSRRAELDSLRLALEDVERNMMELKSASERAAGEHAAAIAALESATAGAERESTALREAQGAGDDAGRSLNRAERELAELEESLEQMNTRLGERLQRLQSVDTELTASQVKDVELSGELERQRGALAELVAAQEAARERLVHWQVEEAQVSAREQAAREREARAEEAISHMQSEIAALKREVAQIETDTQALSEQRTEWKDMLEERKLTVKSLELAARNAEQSLGSAEEAVTLADEAVAAARDELERLGEQAHRIELELTESTGHRRALVERVEAEWHMQLDELLESATPIDGETDELREQAEHLLATIEAMGPVNPLAMQEHEEETARLQFLQEQRADLVEARKGLLQALQELDANAKEMFNATFTQVRQNFKTVFDTLFEGGECDVRLFDESDPLESAIEIYAAPRGKRTQRIHLLSSGERALVALSLLFSIYLTKPAPFCLLDEVDAPLDDANVSRFVRLLEEFKADTQFLVITHNPRTMQVGDAVFGITMQEPGVSTLVGVRLGEPQALAL